MKKIILKLSIIALSISTLNTTAQTGLTNLDFEATPSGSYTAGGCAGSPTVFPFGFGSTYASVNGSGPYTSTLSNVAQSGSKYISISNLNTCGLVDLNGTGTAINPNQPGIGSPYTLKPTSFCGFYRTQGLSTTSDSIFVVVHLTKNGTLIGKGRFSSGTNQSTWTSFCANITYSFSLNPDTIKIRFTPSKTLAGLGSGFNTQTIIMDIDNCSFVFPTSLNENNQDVSNITLYPNPTNNNLIKINGNNLKSYSIYNLVGQNVKAGLLNSNSHNEINISELSKGIYNININALNDTKKIKLVIKD